MSPWLLALSRYCAGNWEVAGREAQGVELVRAGGDESCWQQAQADGKYLELCPFVMLLPRGLLLLGPPLLLSTSLRLPPLSSSPSAYFMRKGL